ncbi:50S ribosomal protein L17 [Proteinivorax hydrogeniformans]|uniref:Large ribosomal subunit protein bL17 n=1 Tax=Proteinivorax hydrogeniformans TaxID=1826727 RepID=A0AAU8HU44_9FIRM
MAHSKFGRTTNQRRALLRGLTTSLLKEGRITTTETKAKNIRPLVEKMITLGKRGDLHARRQAAAFILEKEVVANLFNDIAPKYAERNGGYTRIVKIGPRKGDAAEQVIIELV